MKRVLTLVLVGLMMVACVPKEPPVVETGVEEAVILDSEEEPGDVEEAPDAEEVILEMIFPIIVKDETGYTLQAKDGSLLMEETFESLEYIDRSSFLKGMREDAYYLISMGDYEAMGPYDEDEIEIMIQSEAWNNDIQVFWDQETYDYGYIKEGVMGEGQYDYLSAFVDGYAVLEEDMVYKVVDESFKRIFKHDVKIINYGKGFFGKVVDFAIYDDYYNMAMLCNLQGEEIAGPFFEVDVINDDLILVADHKEGWFINSKGERVKDTLLDAMGFTNYKEAMVVANYLLLFDAREDYSNYAVFSNEGDLIYRTPSVEEDLKVKMRDGYTVEQKSIESSRFVKSIIPVLDQEGSDGLFDVVNATLFKGYALEDNRSVDEVWDTQEISFEARRAGVGIMEFDMFYYYYGFGAAHPNYAMHTEHVDLLTGEMYTLSDLLKSEESFSVLTTLAQEKAGEMEPLFFDINDVSVYKGISFRLEEEGIVFYYDPYEVASYAAGMPEIFIPYSDFVDEIDYSSPFYQSFRPVG